MRLGIATSAITLFVVFVAGTLLKNGAGVPVD
jgi:hypothetical protein